MRTHRLSIVLGALLLASFIHVMLARQPPPPPAPPQMGKSASSGGVVCKKPILDIDGAKVQLLTKEPVESLLDPEFFKLYFCKHPETKKEVKELKKAIEVTDLISMKQANDIDIVIGKDAKALLDRLLQEILADSACRGESDLPEACQKKRNDVMRGILKTIKKFKSFNMALFSARGDDEKGRIQQFPGDVLKLNFGSRLVYMVETDPFINSLFRFHDFVKTFSDRSSSPLHESLAIVKKINAQLAEALDDEAGQPLKKLLVDIRNISNDINAISGKPPISSFLLESIEKLPNMNSFTGNYNFLDLLVRFAKGTVYDFLSFMENLEEYKITEAEIVKNLETWKNQISDYHLFIENSRITLGDTSSKAGKSFAQLCGKELKPIKEALVALEEQVKGNRGLEELSKEMTEKFGISSYNKFFEILGQFSKDLAAAVKKNEEKTKRQAKKGAEEKSKANVGGTDEDLFSKIKGRRDAISASEEEEETAWD